MAVFPSREWCEALVAAINEDPETPRAGVGWDGDFAAAVLAEPPFLKEPFAGYVQPANGKIVGFRILEDLDEIEEIEPAYEARASYTVWKRLILGSLDPIEALVSGNLKFRGDLEPIVARVQFKELLRRAMAKVPTTFVDSGR